MINLYEPFNDITDESSKETETTISKVLSTCMFLIYHLKQFAKNKSLQSFVNTLISELDSRCKPLIDPNDILFSDGLYLASVYLDLRFYKMLNTIQKKAAENFLFNLYQKSKTFKEVVEIEKDPEPLNDKKSLFESFIEEQCESECINESNMDLEFNEQLLNYMQFMNSIKRMG